MHYTAYEQNYLAWYLGDQGQPFDPATLIAAAAPMEARVPGLMAALAHCTQRFGTSDLYHNFLPTAERAPYRGRVHTYVLRAPELGYILLDVMLTDDGRVQLVYGAEYLDRVRACSHSC